MIELKKKLFLAFRKLEVRCLNEGRYKVMKFLRMPKRTEMKKEPLVG